jgi:2-oxoglutarate dehydrogenase E2 component (dihydrolipoamide succinyltransferase)
MAVKVEVPEIGESITEVEIGEWQKSEGDPVEQDETVVVLESDKASVELPAPAAGSLVRILKKPGERAEVGEVIAEIDEDGGGEGKKARGTEAEETAPEEHAEPEDEEKAEEKEPAGRGGGEKAEGGKKRGAAREKKRSQEGAEAPRVMPAARRLLEEHGLEAGDIQASGPGGRLLKEDVQRHLRGRKTKPEGRPNVPRRSCP